MTGGGPPRVALVGANGHGRWHRRTIAELEAAGRLRLVALVDVRPPEVEPDAPVPPRAAVLTDHRAMLATTRPDVVVVCTPPHTHLPIALDALDAGADLLLEKPPVLDLAEHRTLLAASAGRAVQVNFQALGSAALTELTGALERLGPVDRIAALAAWQRPDAYYARSPWAGRRTVDGRPALDGALANPLAHALMQCLAVAEAVTGAPVRPARVEVERYRVRPIEVDDTTVLRLTPHTGPPVLAALTLAAEEHVPGEVLVTGERGQALLEYPTDRLRLPGDPAARAVPGRRGLLANLLDHRATGAPLIAPLARTEPFTAVLDALRDAPVPTLLGGDLVRTVGDGPERVRVIRGVGAVLRTAAGTGALPSETGVPWAVRPYVVDLP
ncbi:Predicted dehydrogenase [Micromonospora sediminicola]|uniref:Predicted dehydrogenase n=1 Tax=Micromonospora sediminicola TaxID=946078 RepID=A0A1A9B9R7_9ACTN|nr:MULTISPECIES: Gfo/Idh/MocA family oxidoreductase [Micromonospora]PGH46439.1 gfo/Idh/MocA family oxidoreductase [Micromonospora sp. WMMA1996]SBT66270.1 Predicted dehydrogenase [Micromonospora sediminicola]